VPAPRFTDPVYGGLENPDRGHAPRRSARVLAILGHVLEKARSVGTISDPVGDAGPDAPRASAMTWARPRRCAAGSRGAPRHGARPYECTAEHAAPRPWSCSAGRPPSASGEGPPRRAPGRGRSAERVPRDAGALEGPPPPSASATSIPISFAPRLASTSPPFRRSTFPRASSGREPSSQKANVMRGAPMLASRWVARTTGFIRVPTAVSA